MSSIIDSLWEHYSYLPLKNRLEHKSISLKEWPEFNPDQFKPEYVTIASILSQQSLTSLEIIKLTQYEDYIVHSFLNAACLLNLIEVQSIEKQAQDKSITHRMKQVLGFYH